MSFDYCQEFSDLVGLGFPVLIWLEIEPLSERWVAVDAVATCLSYKCVPERLGKAHQI